MSVVHAYLEREDLAQTCDDHEASGVGALIERLDVRSPQLRAVKLDDADRSELRGQWQLSGRGAP